MTFLAVVWLGSSVLFGSIITYRKSGTRKPWDAPLPVVFVGYTAFALMMGGFIPLCIAALGWDGE